jgi:hypothetical protein
MAIPEQLLELILRWHTQQVSHDVAPLKIVLAETANTYKFLTTDDKTGIDLNVLGNAVIMMYGPPDRIGGVVHEKSTLAQIYYDIKEAEIVCAANKLKAKSQTSLDELSIVAEWHKFVDDNWYTTYRMTRKEYFIKVRDLNELLDANLTKHALMPLGTPEWFLMDEYITKLFGLTERFKLYNSEYEKMYKFNPYEHEKFIKTGQVTSPPGFYERCMETYRTAYKHYIGDDAMETTDDQSPINPPPALYLKFKDTYV